MKKGYVILGALLISTGVMADPCVEGDPDYDPNVCLQEHFKAQVEMEMRAAEKWLYYRNIGIIIKYPKFKYIDKDFKIRTDLGNFKFKGVQ